MSISVIGSDVSLISNGERKLFSGHNFFYFQEVKFAS